jgi:hypothetical protein
MSNDGDKNFEEFLEEGEDDDGPIFPMDCQKRLFLGALQLKMSSITETLKVYTELNKATGISKEYKDDVTELLKNSKDTLEGIDYLLSLIVQEIDSSDPDEDPENMEEL